MKKPVRCEDCKWFCAENTKDGFHWCGASVPFWADDDEETDRYQVKPYTLSDCEAFQRREVA